MEIGFAGTATLSIAAGGAVSVVGEFGDPTAVVLAGGDAGGAGAITVDGAGSTLTATSFQIGYGGKGSLSVTDGASVDEDSSGADAFEVGSLAGSTGSVSVSGVGSKLVSATGFRVGASGVGSMRITDGATATASEYLVFGFAAGSHGYGTIAGATVMVGKAGVGADDVLIGEDGVGALTIGAGGVLTDADSAGVGARSSLAMAGGSFSSTVLTNQGAITGFGAIRGAVVNDSKVTATGGTMLLNEALTGTGSESISATGTLQLAGASLGTTGVVWGAAGSTLDGHGTVASRTNMAGTVTSSGITFSGVGNRFSGTLAGKAAIAFSGGSETFAGTTITAARVNVSGASVTLSGSIALGGLLVATTSDLVVSTAGATLTGSGVLELTNLSTNKIAGASAAATLTNGATIEGAGALGAGTMTLINGAKGVINGDDLAALKIDTGSVAVANAGLIEATGRGGLAIAGAVKNTGLLAAAGGKLEVDGAVSGAGSVTITAGTADFAGTFNEDVTFDGTTGTLELAHARTYSGKISGFSLTGGTSLDLVDIGFTGGVTKATFGGSATSGVLTVTSGAEVAKINLVGDYRSSVWTLSTDGHGGTKIVDPIKAASSTETSRPTSNILPFIAAMGSFDPGGSVDWAGNTEFGQSHPLLLAAVRSGK